MIFKCQVIIYYKKKKIIFSKEKACCLVLLGLTFITYRSFWISVSTNIFIYCKNSLVFKYFWTFNDSNIIKIISFYYGLLLTPTRFPLKTTTTDPSENPLNYCWTEYCVGSYRLVKMRCVLKCSKNEKNLRFTRRFVVYRAKYTQR